MNFSLSDLVPPLRWSDAARIPELRHPELPPAWWRSLPMPRVLATIGPEELAKLLTELALTQWPAAAIGDVLPALHVLDPEEADEPHVAIALDRAGSWPGLLALTGHDLREQPFIQAAPVLTTLFGAVLARLVEEVAAPRAARPEPAAAETDLPRREQAAPAPAVPEPPRQEVPLLREPFTSEPPAPREPADAAEEPDAAAPPPAPPRMPYATPAPARPSGRDAEPEPGPAEEIAAPPPVPAAAEADDAPEDLPALIDAAFADLDDADWAVAQNRVFSPEPAAAEALAKLFAVPPEEIEARTAGVRGRADAWLASGRAAPYRAHLEQMAELLGAAAPKSRLIGAATWHREQLRSLDIPAWQFVLTTLPGGYRLDGDWVVAGDLRELRARTRELLRALERPPSPAQAVELVGALGIHPDVAKEWLESMPPLPEEAAPEPPAAAPPVTAVPPPLAAAEAPAAFAGPEAAPPEAAEAPADDSLVKPFGQLKDVALTRRCFRQPDGRWWLRVDVTEDHLAGGECPLPSGFAAYLGLTPGSSRTVRSASGEVTINWQNRPVIVPVNRLFKDIGAVLGGHVFLTLSDEGVLRARHLAPADDADDLAAALRLVGYTAPGGTPEQAVRVIATRIGIPGPVTLADLLPRLRERGDRDLLALLQ